MERLVRKYADKLVSAGLAEVGDPLVAGLDAELVWNRDDAARATLAEVFDGLDINSLVFCQPAEPYRSIIDYLAGESGGAIRPNDCETRTFLHDLPVVREFGSGRIVEALKQRKSVIVSGRGIVTWGTVSPEQAFVCFSSVCFACFVKFFSDYMTARRTGMVTKDQQRVFDGALPLLDEMPDGNADLVRGPLATDEEVCKAMCQVGRMTVAHRLVDSYFGNISYRLGDTLHISQTGSSLDEMEGLIDPVPLDGSSCAGITASSELTAHREVIRTTGNNAVLHGHPKFSVIISMDCGRGDCEFLGRCHLLCPDERMVDGVRIVPGEVGTGRYGLCNSLPPAMLGGRGAIVYGHGVFTVGKDDFNAAFEDLVAIERTCREEYFRRLGD